jgi:hypothetical protein
MAVEGWSRLDQWARLWLVQLKQCMLLGSKGGIIVEAHDLPSTKRLSATVPLTLERLFFCVCPLVSLNMFDSPESSKSTV